MFEDQYLDIFMKISYHILTRDNSSKKPYKQFCLQYCNQLKRIIRSSQLSTINSIISWYYLYKYASNTVCSIDSEEGMSMISHLIFTSFILANKSFDDQCYSCKTWSNIANSSDTNYTYDLKVIKQLESHFLSVVDYKLSFTAIDNDDFWTFLQVMFNDTNSSSHVLHHLKSKIIPTTDASLSIPVTPILYDNFTSPATVSLKSPMTPLTPFSLDRKRTYSNMDYGSMEKLCNSINLDEFTNFEFGFTAQ
ncbi:DEHA2B03520p [Debaryomyces hansenii CBS767]|uniref:DEHA2B03520p n=1 Tax=Debaryomyces hansenii (strain ATCC 36239 / CBS 767 / BCRC 21394 / JCM 1990 / NBRC 0083 / IGC 2968) TaxID=284592 RepID=B5RT36_DEBHA|nr:DEHA2B03520p [Debaryomyces hansenii CBS767]CAR65441.1 DEHA2B03520p [Debaryomyces hansenii CBS767]|eukprot:XP_002770071.1 DEHA2B03520p [Debaryomyces hansenii CBS767]